jgi:hypothetical protein
VVDNGAWRPCEITPASTGTDASGHGLVTYLKTLSDLGEMLIREKALVFRGFNVATGTLDSVMDVLLPSRLAYVHGNSPRSKVGENVYTSTEYPPQLTISMHNELSYAARWPSPAALVLRACRRDRGCHASRRWRPLAEFARSGGAGGIRGRSAVQAEPARRDRPGEELAGDC